MKNVYKTLNTKSDNEDRPQKQHIREETQCQRDCYSP